MPVNDCYTHFQLAVSDTTLSLSFFSVLLTYCYVLVQHFHFFHFYSHLFDFQLGVRIGTTPGYFIIVPLLLTVLCASGFQQLEVISLEKNKQMMTWTVVTNNPLLSRNGKNGWLHKKSKILNPNVCSMCGTPNTCSRRRPVRQSRRELPWRRLSQSTMITFRSAIIVIKNHLQR